MSKIYTLTLSPALDKSTFIERVIPENKLRCEEPKFEAGGGGINISRALRKLEGHSVAIWPKGGHVGILMEDLLAKDGIEQITIPAQNWNRENFTVVESSTNRQYRFGMPGPALLEEEWRAMLKVVAEAADLEFIVVSGSTPDGVPNTFYSELSTIAKEKNAKLVLDTSGESLHEALKIGVYLCKPNLHELSELVGRELDTLQKQEAAALEIIETGKVEVLVVSMGPFGALMAAKEGIYHVAAPPVQKRSTVGAGDSMVAGLVHCLSKDWKLQETLKYAVACGTAATMNTGTELCNLEDVQYLYQWINSRTPSRLYRDYNF
jgi:6-phosphofructokinase 2